MSFQALFGILAQAGVELIGMADALENVDVIHTPWPSFANAKAGGAEGDRTPDLRNAIATLSQLSYGPVRPRL